MSDNLVFGDAHLLANLDVVAAAGGYQDGQIGEGGGPSCAESTIEDMFQNWSAPALSNMGDEWTSYMADGAMFYDSDGNGYYDHLEKGGDNGVFVFDPETGCWVFRAYEDEDAS